MILNFSEIHELDLQGGRVVGVTSGCFDLLHYYHLHFLERCKAQCEFLIVGVDADSLVLQNKGKPPVIPEDQRTAMVHALKCVDAVFTMRSVFELKWAAAWSVKMFKNAGEIYGKPVELEGNCELVIIPDVSVITSTTEIVEKIRIQ